MAGDVTKNKVAVLVGGWSDEQDISRSSGAACAKALGEAGFEHVDVLEVSDDDFVGRLVAGDYDVAFVAMHGRYGEDGQVQGLLDVLHIPYTFSGVLASAMATEKDIAKMVYKTAGIPVPDGVEFKNGHKLTDDEADALVERLGLPIFVKPAADGASYGITRVTEKSQLAAAIDLAGKKGDHALCEECITGMEITVPVIGNDDPKALLVVEIVTGSDFYDLKVKYEPSHLHHVIPARLDEKTTKLAQEYAVRAHVALGCRGASRTDFIVTDDGTPVILETNTIPGMTETSLLPDSARRSGIEFPELCKYFVELALEDGGEC